MGSSSSRLGLNPSQGRLNRRFNRFPRLPSFFTCSSGSSYAPLEMEDYPTQIPVKSSEHRGSLSNMVQTPLEESGSICSTETGLSSTGTETGTSAESNNEAGGDLSIDGGSRDVEANDCRKCLTESKDLVVPQSVAVKTKVHLGFVLNQVFHLLKGLKIHIGYLLRINCVK